MTLEQDIIRVLQQACDEIRANMQSKGINASGRTQRGFAVEKDGDSIRLVLNHDEKAQVECKPNGFGSVQVGTAPLSTLEIGREGGRVPKGFYYMIKQWTRDKGLVFGSESERQTFSYFTARKIAKQGTRRREQPVDVWSTPLRKAEEQLSNDIRLYIAQGVQEAVQKNF